MTMNTEQIDAHALLEELREMISTNTNVDWDMQDAKDEFETLLEYIDRRRPVTMVWVALKFHEGSLEDVMTSKTDFEDPEHVNHIPKEHLAPLADGSTGWRVFSVDLEE